MVESDRTPIIFNISNFDVFISKESKHNLVGCKHQQHLIC